MDKESLLSKMADLMARIEASGFDEKCETIINQLSFAIENYESIDKEMVAKLTGIFQDSLEKKEVFDIDKAIDEGSTIVYFKSAQLFKVYKKEELMSSLDAQLGTIYKNFNKSFEVVPNNSEQKIIIMGDITLVDQIEHIKKYILQFMIDKGVQNFKNDDIICFKNKSTNMIEIVINNYYVNNSSERDEIVRDLLKYILKMEKNSNMNRMLGYLPDSTEFENADVVSMPSEKQLLNEDTKFIEMADRMIRNTSNCSKLVKEGNKFIVNFSNMPINNNNITCVVEKFVNYILKNKPKWYKNSKWIKKDLIYNECVLQCGPLSKKAFATTFRNVLFCGEDRKMVDNERCYIVKLLKYSEIISLTNSLTDVENCQYIFEHKQLPNEVITNHNNVYIFTDNDWQQQLRKNFKRDSQWVYFIQDASGIKIGMTKNLNDRKSSLQTGNSHRLEIIAYIESENMSDLEKSFHQYLKPLWIMGEWFKLDKEKTVKMLRGWRNNKMIYNF